MRTAFVPEFGRARKPFSRNVKQPTGRGYEEPALQCGIAPLRGREVRTGVLGVLIAGRANASDSRCDVCEPSDGARSPMSEMAVALLAGAAVKGLLYSVHGLAQTVQSGSELLLRLDSACG